MSVNRDEQDARILVEDFLGRVSMMGVPIEDSHFLDLVGLLRIPGCCCRIVEKAESTELIINASMVAWRSHRCEAVLPLAGEEIVDTDLHCSHSQPRRSGRLF